MSVPHHYDPVRRPWDSGQAVPAPAPETITAGLTYEIEVEPQDAAEDAVPPTQRSERTPGMPAQKHDTGKLPLELIPTRPLEAMARVLAFGARKYAPNNWRNGLAYSRVYAAIMRHMWAWWRGEDLDPETGEPHLAHAYTELTFLLEYSLRKGGPGELDDRVGNDL